jgi:myo-inositol-1(or 4)-monophosphatase
MGTANPSLLATCIEAATLSGKMLREAFENFLASGKLSVKEKSFPGDLVTEVDAAVQRAVIDFLHARFPTHRFLGEEEGSDALGDPSDPHCWIIDPLDGTLNFVHGKPRFGTMIALQKGKTIDAGVIYRPMQDELFAAARGSGAMLNGKPVTLRRTTSMQDAVIAANIIHRAKSCTGGALHVSVPRCASVENYGNAAEEIGEVLLGRNDGVFFDGVGLWDIAAGCVLMEEAGGQVKWEWKDPKNPRGGVRAVLSTKEIFEELCDFLFGPSQ